MKNWVAKGVTSDINDFILRGLFKNFKIPIWYRFDTILRKEELLSIMEKIESLGYHIVSMTCDMHKSNQKLSTDLGVTIENPRFENPFRPGSYVYWIFDPCHLLKVAFTYDIIFFWGIFDLPTGCCQKFETDKSPFYDHF